MKSPFNRKLVKRMLIGVVLLSSLILVVLHRSEIEQFAELARRAQPLWLCVGVVLQVGTYFCVAAAWRAALRPTGSQLSVPSIVPLAFAKLFSDQAMPSGGMSGNAFLVAALSRRGISKPICMATLLVSIVSACAANLLVAAVSVVLLWFFHQLQPWILIVAGIFALVAIAVPSISLWLQHWGGGDLPPWSRRLPMLRRFLDVLGDAPGDLVRDPNVLWTATACQTMVILLDAGTLWIMLLAVGQATSFWIVLPSFFLASMVATITPIPLGLGTFEATCVTALHLLGIPVAPALTATLLFRGFTMWLPMLPGLWLARREFAGRTSEEEPGVILPLEGLSKQPHT